MDSARTWKQTAVLWAVRCSLVLAAGSAAAVAAWSVVEISPWYQHQRQRAFLNQIESATGLMAQEGTYRAELDGWAALENVVLVNPETEKPVLRARLVRMRRPSREVVKVEIAGAHIDRRQLIQCIDRWRAAIWKRRTPDTIRQVRVSAQDVHWRDPPHRQSFHTASLKWQFDEHRLTTTASIKPIGEGHPISVRVIRYRQSGLWQLGLDTNKDALDLQPWSTVVPGVDKLGDQAAFAGTAEFEWDATEWTCRLNGHVQHVNLERLVTQHLPHKLSGRAGLDFSSVVVANNRLVSGECQLSAMGGSISRGLLQGLVDVLHWQTNRDVVQLPDVVPYDAIGLRLRVDRGQLSVAGTLAANGQCLQASREGLALAAPSGPVDWLSVSHVLIPGQQWLAPTSGPSGVSRLSSWLESARVPLKLRTTESRTARQ